jgi:AraC-like DNA-binding protein
MANGNRQKALPSARGMRAARLQAMKADVLANLGRSDLTAASVAARHDVTPRYVQMLFETEGQSFSEFVLEHRLTRVRAMLRDPKLSSRTISGIAYDAGFGDISYFNRVFRQRYGATPSEVRACAPCDGTH